LRHFNTLCIVKQMPQPNTNDPAYNVMAQAPPLKVFI
jgi:hypothetical protein